MVAIKFSETEKSILVTPEQNVFMKVSEEKKTKFHCPADGNVEGVSEVFENSVGEKIFHNRCSVCGWVKVVPEKRRKLEEKQKPTATLVCPKCKYEFFGSHREATRQYEKHLKEHIIKDVNERGKKK